MTDKLKSLKAILLAPSPEKLCAKRKEIRAILREQESKLFLRTRAQHEAFCKKLGEFLTSVEEYESDEDNDQDVEHFFMNQKYDFWVKLCDKALKETTLDCYHSCFLEDKTELYMTYCNEVVALVNKAHYYGIIKND